MNKTKNETHIDSCLNCSHTIQAEDSFCSHCGQMARSSRITIWRILSEFFSNVFNLDSRFFKSLRFIFLPSRLPKEYMDGKRRSYINPARFFFVTLVIHFAVLAIVTKDFTIDEGFGKLEADNLKRLELVEISEKFDSLASIYPIEDQENLDSIKSKLFQDTIMPNLGYMTFSNVSIGDVDFADGITISNYDMLVLEPDEAIKKYKIEKFWQKLQFKQMYKLRKNPKAAFQFFIGNALWVVIFITIFSALFLKLLYIRRKFYLVDHLVVSMYYHSVILIILTIFYGLNMFMWTNDNINYLSTIILLMIPLYGFLTLKKYYKQGNFKTIIKFMILGLFEFITLGLFALIVFLVSALIF